MIRLVNIIFIQEMETKLSIARNSDADSVHSIDGLLIHSTDENTSSCSVTMNNVIKSQKPKNQGDIYVMRHGERIDFCFGYWIPRSVYEHGEYVRKNLNLPIKLPQRHGYPESFRQDTPLTNIGVFQAKLTGEGLLLAGVDIRYVFCSPALRCIETCHHVLTGMGIANDLKIKIEYGLFEWLKWYQGSRYPDWMTDEELILAEYKIDTQYKPLFSRKTLKDHSAETCSQYYERNFKVMEHILKVSGEKDRGNILIVAHGFSLDTCSRQLTGCKPRTWEALKKLSSGIPFCSVIKIQRRNNRWQVVEAPIPPLDHLQNPKFDWKTLINPDL